MADIVVVGRVIGPTERSIQIAIAWGDKLTCKVYKIEVLEVLKGPKDLEHLNAAARFWPHLPGNDFLWWLPREQQSKDDRMDQHSGGPSSGIGHGWMGAMLPRDVTHSRGLSVIHPYARPPVYPNVPSQSLLWGQWRQQQYSVPVPYYGLPSPSFIPQPYYGLKDTTLPSYMPQPASPYHAKAWYPLLPIWDPWRPGLNHPGQQRGATPTASVFFLKKHETEDCYVATDQYPVSQDSVLIDQTKQTIARLEDKKIQVLKNPQAALRSEVPDTRDDKKIQVLKNPQAALRSEDYDTRMYAAQVLLVRYRTKDGDRPESFTAPYVDESVKTEPIDAAESRLILRTLAEGDWIDEREAAALGRIFNLLWGNGHPLYEVLTRGQQRDWLMRNADTFQIRRLVHVGEKTGGIKK